MPTETASRRFALRAQTADAHAALDALVGEWADLRDYEQYLAGITGFRLAIEDRLWDGPMRVLGGWSSEPIGEALRADCRDLGVTPAKVFAEGRDLAGDSAAAGIAYVLEGSSIGARLLLRRAVALGLTPEFGARHLARQAGHSWAGFLAALEAAPDLDMAAAARGANAAFDLARRAFEERLHAAV